MDVKETLKIILISYYFSSKYETGGIRAQKFAKYLPAFGVEPLVVTRKVTDHYPFQGKCFFVRTLPIHWPFHLESFTWIPGLFWTCLKLIRKEKIDALLFCCGPFPVVIVGVFLKRLFGVKLVLDYRDYWTPSPYVSRISRFHRHLNRVLMPLERWFLRYTDRLILVQREMETKYLYEFPFLKGKTETIFNGFDEEDLSGGLEEEFEKRTLLHLGNLHLDLNPTYPMLLLKGLQKLKTEKVLTESNFEVVVVGEQFEAFNEKVRELGLSGIVSNLERLPHSEAIPYLKRAHVLLIVVETEGIMTSKIFEYLAVGKPVFALIKPGELMELIQEFSPASIIVTSYDLDEIVKGIERCIAWKADGSERDGSHERFRNEYNRRALTKQLTKVLVDVSCTGDVCGA